jgi:hypothetical protein
MGPQKTDMPDDAAQSDALLKIPTPLRNHFSLRTIVHLSSNYDELLRSVLGFSIAWGRRLALVWWPAGRVPNLLILCIVVLLL